MLRGAARGRGELGERQLRVDVAGVASSLVIRGPAVRIDTGSAALLEQAACLVMSLKVAGCGGDVIEGEGQCVILRSTVYPGTTEKVHNLVAGSGRAIHVAFCPERVAEGKAMVELTELPQIVSGCDEQAVAMAERLFGRIARSILRLSPLEAELTKIFANVWRYIQFATANQFFMIAADYGLDFYRIYDALTRDYPRMAGLPRPPIVPLRGLRSWNLTISL